MWVNNTNYLLWDADSRIDADWLTNGFSLVSILHRSDMG